MKEFNVDLALKMNKLVHDECKDVPHDIGMKLACLVTDFLPVLNKTDCYAPLLADAEIIKLIKELKPEQLPEQWAKDEDMNPNYMGGFLTAIRWAMSRNGV